PVPDVPLVPAMPPAPLFDASLTPESEGGGGCGILPPHETIAKPIQLALPSSNHFMTSSRLRRREWRFATFFVKRRRVAASHQKFRSAVGRAPKNANPMAPTAVTGAMRISKLGISTGHHEGVVRAGDREHAPACELGHAGEGNVVPLRAHGAEHGEVR